MAIVQYKTPDGVYIDEVDPFSPSIVGVETAVPAFIGYTEKAERNGQPCHLVPVRITSLADYAPIFGGAYPYRHMLTAVAPGTAGAVMIGASCFRPDIVQRYDFFDSLRLFYANGGGTCYVVSVGSYQDAPSQAAFEAGLAAVRDRVGPTILVIPEAARLAPSAYAAVALAMLTQCHDKQDRVAILDVPMASDAVPDPVAAFRAMVSATPPEARQYGMAYYPFVQTSLVDASTLGYGSLAPSARAPLQDALLAVAGNDAALRALIARITQVGPDDPDYAAINQRLTAQLPALRELAAAMAALEGVLPPSGAMAGVYTQNDTLRGVWNAPANVGLVSVIGPTVKITNNKMQEGLNMPLDGLAINAIRDFVGRGTLVWGARTLDGNSNDWRYIQVRRALIYIDQSVKLALNKFVYEPNVAQTWLTVTSMIGSFLRGVWQAGGLMGGSPAEAFSVQCGLGSTMTAQDVLEGRMIVQIRLQMVRPAEFIVLTFEQQMQGGA
jgi:phage tail sheath protein FI